MSEPIRVPADPSRAIADYLTAELPALASPPSLTVSRGVPDDWTFGSSAPHVGVFDDGGPVRWPIITEPRIRVTVWHSGRDAARELAALVCGILMCRTVPSIATITDPSGILDARDAKNRGLMASFTVKVQARTIAL
ncbi:MAG: hypothetical protein WBK76_04825 [Candidatus Saccharimonadales bacterium]